MPDLAEYGSAFTQILRKLDEEHNRLISLLCEEHAGELSQLRSEHQHQLTSLRLQAASKQAPVALTQSLPASSKANGVKTAAGVDTYQQAVSCSSRSDYFDASLGHVNDLSYTSEQTSHTPVSKSGISESPMGNTNSKLQRRVLHHLKRDNLDSVNRYAMARGWEIIPLAQQHQTKIQRLVAHQGFDTVCASAIFLNTALLGAVTSFRASTLDAEELPLHYRIANIVFSCWFLVELTLRWTSEGFLAFFSSSRHASWNLFDIFVVGTDIIEHAVDVTTDGESSALANLNVMRMLRVLRIARALRVVRLLKFCEELRVMVLSVLKSGRSLIWSMVLLSIIFYIFAIFLMQAVTEHLASQVSEMDSWMQEPRFSKESTEGKLERYFGSLTMTFYVLFQSVSGGLSWCEVSDPLLEVNEANAIVFCLFIFFTVFAMLNIIMGFFVETSFNSMKADNDEVIQEEMKSENSLVKHLHNIFLAADTDKKGWISEEQFAALVEDVKVHALLKGLGLHVSEAKGLFALLDLDRTGVVSIDDFIIGCMRLRGGAQEVDLVSLMYENRTLLASHNQLGRLVKSEFERLDNFEERVEEFLQAVAMIPGLLNEIKSNLATAHKVRI